MTLGKLHNELRDAPSVLALSEQIREIATSAITAMSDAVLRRGEPGEPGPFDAFAIEATVVNAMHVAEQYEIILQKAVRRGGRLMTPADILLLLHAATASIQESKGSAPEIVVFCEVSRSLSALNARGLTDSPGLSAATKALVLATEAARQSGVTLVLQYLKDQGYQHIEPGTESKAIGELIEPIMKNARHLVEAAIQGSMDMALTTPEPASSCVH